MRREDVVRDVEEMLTAREDPERIAERIGLSAVAITRALYRAGRRDLVRPFAPACRVERRRRAGRRSAS